eukprot:SAG31_NODE_1804_length_7234_cov_3.340855_7_plen_213_part_00
MDKRLGAAEPNVCVASLNEKADSAADVGAEFSTDRSTGCTPDVLLPVGGFRFVWTYQGRLCTQDTRTCIRKMVAGQALEYAQAYCKEQGAVFREIEDVDRCTLESVVSDPELSNVARRSINGTISSLKTMRRNHPEIMAGLLDGPYCVLCRQGQSGAVGDARHVLFCPAEGMREAQDSYMAAVETVFTTAITAWRRRREDVRSSMVSRMGGG